MFLQENKKVGNLCGFAIIIFHTCHGIQCVQTMQAEYFQYKFVIIIESRVCW